MSNQQSQAARLYELILRPRVTEKATLLANSAQQYTFDVNPDANKIELAKAFELLYPGRKVINVRTTKIYPREKRVGRKTGHTPVGKKATFTIQGEPIELFTGA